MRKINFVIIVWILSTLIGGIMKMYHIEFANWILIISLLSFSFGIYLFVKNKVKTK